MKKTLTAGERMIESAKQALSFAKGQENHGCKAHVPDDIECQDDRGKHLVVSN
jgi:hypothetical protein